MSTSKPGDEKVLRRTWEFARCLANQPLGFMLVKKYISKIPAIQVEPSPATFSNNQIRKHDCLRDANNSFIPLFPYHNSCLDITTSPENSPKQRGRSCRKRIPTFDVSTLKW